MDGNQWEGAHQPGTDKGQKKDEDMYTWLFSTKLIVFSEKLMANR